MAIIRNVKANSEIHFNLKRSREDDWLNYRLEVYIIDSNNHRSCLENLSLLNYENLYLDAIYDPEVPQLIEGIKKILSGEIEYYLFSPVDEKDFILELICREKLFLNYFRANDIPGFWEGMRITIDQMSLAKFAEDLAQEYRSLGYSNYS